MPNTTAISIHWVKLMRRHQGRAALVCETAIVAFMRRQPQ
jgi:hypothetical protein